MIQDLSDEDVEHDVPDSWREAPVRDDLAAEMHRLRGLVMAQGTETETVLRRVVAHLNPDANVEKSTAGRLVQDVRRLLSDEDEQHWEYELCGIEEAVERRNHAVHSKVSIGSVWRDYATGGGERVPVISLLGDEVYDEADLLEDFGLQQAATRFAVEILLYLQRGEG